MKLFFNRKYGKPDRRWPCISLPHCLDKTACEVNKIKKVRPLKIYACKTMNDQKLVAQKC